MRTPKELTISHDTNAHLLFLTDTVHVYDSVNVSVRNDTVWRDRVRFIDRQVERLQHDTVRTENVVYKTMRERYVPRWLWYLLAIGAAAVVAWLLKALWWLLRLRR